MNSLKQDQLKYGKSAAFHEAAHYILCIAQEIPVRELGLRIDSKGNGRSHIYCRESGKEIKSEIDKQEIEKSIVLLFAGYLGQLKFFPELKDMRDVADAAIKEDLNQIDALLSDMYPNKPEGWYKAKGILQTESDRLIKSNWSAIKALANALWDQPWKPQVQVPPIDTGWSDDKKEKSMNARDVAAILREFGLSPIIRADV
jgi:hypothetical protein